MESSGLPLPGYNEVVPGRLYVRRAPTLTPACPSRTAEVLMLARVRSVQPEQTYAFFSSIARQLVGPSDPMRTPSDTELTVCQLPEPVVRKLAEGVESARTVLEPIIGDTETGRVPRRGELLGHSRSTRGHWGHRWSAYVPLKRGAVPRTWMIIAGYEGRHDAPRSIQAPLLIEADERIGSIYSAVHAREQLALVAARQELYESAHHGRLAYWLLDRAMHASD